MQAFKTKQKNTRPANAAFPGMKGYTSLQHQKVRSIIQRTRTSVTETVTTGRGDEGVTHTTLNEGSAIQPDLTRTQSLGAGSPASSPAAGSHHCVPTVIRSNLPSGHIAARASGGKFDAPFDMTADFSAPIPCSGRCGEYRQFVSGYFQLNGTDLVHQLCSNTLSRTTEHEDCLSSGGTTYKYGYHSIPFANSRFTNPDQATGFSYRGHDAPGYNLSTLPSGSMLNYNLSFRGELVDACDSDRQLQTSSTWTAGGTYTVP